LIHILEAVVSAQKTALVCLIVFAAFLANGLMELMEKTRTVVSVSSDHVQVSVCMRIDTAERCTLAVEVDTAR
jgi:cell division protein FtsX